MSELTKYKPKLQYSITVTDLNGNVRKLNKLDIETIQYKESIGNIYPVLILTTQVQGTSVLGSKYSFVGGEELLVEIIVLSSENKIMWKMKDVFVVANLQLDFLTGDMKGMSRLIIKAIHKKMAVDLNNYKTVVYKKDSINIGDYVKQLLDDVELKSYITPTKTFQKRYFRNLFNIEKRQTLNLLTKLSFMAIDKNDKGGFFFFGNKDKVYFATLIDIYADFFINKKNRPPKKILDFFYKPYKMKWSFLRDPQNYYTQIKFYPAIRYQYDLLGFNHDIVSYDPFMNKLIHIKQDIQGNEEIWENDEQAEKNKKKIKFLGRYNIIGEKEKTRINRVFHSLQYPYQSRGIADFISYYKNFTLFAKLTIKSIRNMDDYAIGDFIEIDVKGAQEEDTIYKGEYFVHSFNLTLHTYTNDFFVELEIAKSGLWKSLFNFVNVGEI